MMGFSTDRDLLAIEPHLFRDVPLMGQERVNVADGAVSGTTLTSATGGFDAAQVDAGGVVLVDGIACEVLSRTDASTLEVSLVRADVAGAGIGPGAGSGLSVVVRTFAPQAAMVCEVLMRVFGIDPEAGGVGEEQVLSRELMRRVEVVGTLERVYSAAVALVGENEVVQAKAREYRVRCNRMIREATVLIDADGDGVGEIVRRVGVGRLHRA